MTDLTAWPGLSYRLIRSDRRTLSLGIDGEGALVVRAPRHMPLRGIEAFILQKRGWIEAKQAQAAAVRLAPFVPEEGARLPWLGGELRLRPCAVPICVDFDGWLLLPRQGDPWTLLRAWRKRRAQEELGPRVHAWEDRMGLKARSVAYTCARRRWGSMSGAGALRLNAALMHCAPELCDYVIVHELAHIVHPNHSPAFHALVKTHLPQADGLRAHLRSAAGVTALLTATGEAP